ncbi:unnamed protein product [Withania somnifera]
MATASASLNQHRSLVVTQRGVSSNSRIGVPTRFFSSGVTSRIKASSAVAVEPELKTPTQDATEVELFACPICYELLIRKGPSGFNVPAIYRSGFKCRKCNKSYSSKDIFLDLTVTSGTKQYTEVKPARSELFRSPVVSFLYERGWRQNFNRSGFPGPDEEWVVFQEICQIRGLLKSLAFDFSENMLRQCYDFIKNDESIISSNLALVRADVSRLPFFSGSVDAVHAGAALHCWPSLSNVIAEIKRILHSGGVFHGTTFLRVNPSAPTIFRALEQSFLSERDESKFPFDSPSATRTYSYFTQEEIEDLVISCGLINYTSKVQGFSAQKR